MTTIVLKSKPTIKVKDIVDVTHGYYIGKPKPLSENCHSSPMYPMKLWELGSVNSEKKWQNLSPEDISILLKEVLQDITPYCMFKFAESSGLEYAKLMRISGAVVSTKGKYHGKVKGEH